MYLGLHRTSTLGTTCTKLLLIFYLASDIHSSSLRISQLFSYLHLPYFIVLYLCNKCLIVNLVVYSDLIQ